MSPDITFGPAITGSVEFDETGKFSGFKFGVGLGAEFMAGQSYTSVLSAKRGFVGGVAKNL